MNANDVVSTIKSATEQYRPQINLLIRYGLVGGAGAIFYASLYCGFVYLTDGRSVVSSLIAYAAAVVFQYFTHARFTFSVSSHDRAQAIKFLVVTIAGFTISSLIAYAGPRAGLPPLGVAMIVVIAVPLFNLISLATWVFQTRSDDA